MSNNKLNELKAVNQSEIDVVIERITDKTNILVKHLSNILRDIEKNNEDAFINSLGIIQSSSYEIDNLCGQLYALKKAKKMLQELNEK